MLDHLASALDDAIPRPLNAETKPLRVMGRGRDDVDLGLDQLFFHDETLPIYPKGGRVLTVDENDGSPIWFQRMCG
jgi:hypothetical protein